MKLPGSASATLRLSAPAVALGALLAASGAVSGQQAPAAHPAEVARAEQAMNTLQQALLTKLRAAMEQGGPAAAVTVCHDEAVVIADRVAREEHIALGRTSHRLRNVANAAAPWMEPLLAEFLEKPGDRTYRAVRLPDGSIGYVEPIYVRPVCLSCHGKNIAPPVAELLKTSYPQDHAKDFEAGDLRGLYWVKLSPGANAAK